MSGRNDFRPLPGVAWDVVVGGRLGSIQHFRADPGDGGRGGLGEAVGLEAQQLLEGGVEAALGGGLMAQEGGGDSRPYV